VLLYRAVTYLPPIPLGAIACLTWRHAPGLIRTSPHNTSPAGHRPAPALAHDSRYRNRITLTPAVHPAGRPNVSRAMTM